MASAQLITCLYYSEVYPFRCLGTPTNFTLAANSQYLICQDNQTHFIRSDQRVQEYIQGIGAIYSIADGVNSLPRPRALLQLPYEPFEFYQGATPTSPIIQMTRFVDQSHYKLKQKQNWTRSDLWVRQ